MLNKEKKYLCPPVVLYYLFVVINVVYIKEGNEMVVVYLEPFVWNIQFKLRLEYWLCSKFVVVDAKIYRQEFLTFKITFV